MNFKSKLLISILIMLVVGFSHSDVFAQKLYVKGALGYGIGTQKDFYSLRSDYNHIMQDTTISSSVYNLQKVSFGQGPYFEFTLGSHLSEYVSVELSGFYHSSNEQKLSIEENNDYDYFYVNFLMESSLRGTSYGIKPAILLWIPGDNFKPYFKLGGIMAFGSITEESETRVFNTHPHYYPTESISYVFEYKSKFDFGYMAGAGFEINLAKALRFYSEIQYCGYRMVPHSGKYSEYIYREENIVNSLTVSEREYEYVDEYSSGDNQYENEPTKQLKESFSSNSVSILVGLKFNILD